MNTQGYTVFTGPLKHGSKKPTESQKLQQQIIFKSEHSNKNNQLDGRKIAKIMNSEQDHKPPSMPQQLRIAIAQARNAKGLNQQQFAKLIQIPKSEVNSWQAGKSVPTGLNIVKMQKALGTKLPRPKKK